MPNGRQQHFTIPKSLLKAFGEEQRIVFKPIPGLWPVDIRLLNEGILKNLMTDKEFNERCEVVITPR
jgi:hypothetical protein